jgi:hypothetical protein
LERLVLDRNCFVADDTLVHCTALTSLSLRATYRVSGPALRALVRLRELDLSGNYVIHYPSALSNCTNLHTLILDSAVRLPGVAILGHTQLRDLSLQANDQVLDRHLTTLSGLTALDLLHNSAITWRGLSALRQLRWVQLFDGTVVHSRDDAIACTKNRIIEIIDD